MDGGNTFRQARALGTIRRGSNSFPVLNISDSLNVSAGETQDWFKFRVKGRSSALGLGTIFTGGSISDNPAVSLMTVFRANKGKPGRAIVRLDNINSQKSIQRLPEGNYFVRFSGNPPAAGSPEPDTSYSMRIDF
jgi:hypothetical protein